MSAPQVLQQRGSVPSYLEREQLHHGGHSSMRPNNSMSYHDVQAYGHGSFAASSTPPLRNSPQPGYIVYDEWHRPYISRGDTQTGTWRSYVTEEGLAEPTLWPYRSIEYQRPVPMAQQIYPSPQFHGQSNIVLPLDHGSAHQTPRATPDLILNTAYDHVPRTKRKKPVKPKDKIKRAALEKPLSELTKGMSTVPVKDTEAWVNRPYEERKREKRTDGSIKRPSNSFMLYRSAYTERCRELEKSKNHQDISSIAGASWALETPAIKAQFEEWAKVERENHQKAFPDYKFQPQTQAVKDRKRKRKTGEVSGELSDAEDPSWHNDGGILASRPRSTRKKNPRSTYREYSDSPSFTSQDEANTPEPYMLNHGPSYIPDISFNKPLPTAMDRLGPQNDYHITSQPNADYAAYEYANGYQYLDNNVFDTYDSVSPPIGLPGGSHTELMGESAMDEGHLMLTSTQMLDPELQNHDQMSHGQAQGLVAMAPPGSARSAAFHASDYLREGDGSPYLTSFDQVG